MKKLSIVVLLGVSIFTVPHVKVLDASDLQVSAQSSALKSVRVYPNPWKVDENSGSGITIADIGTQAKVQIYTISGQHVASLPAADTKTTWNLKNSNGENVASGVYLFVVSNNSGDTMNGKLAVLR